MRPTQDNTLEVESFHLALELLGAKFLEGIGGLRSVPDFVVTPGHTIRTFGGWYRHDYVTYHGVKLAGYIQVRLRNKRIETLTIFSPLSSAVIGRDERWLLRMHRDHNDVAVANGFDSIAEVL